MPAAPQVVVLGINYPPELSGISPYTGAFAGGLVRRGFSVRGVTAHPHYPDWMIREGYGQWTKREVIEGVKVARLRHYVPSNPRGIHRLLSEISLGLRQALANWGRPDVVVAVSPALFSAAIAALRPRRVPLVVWVQDLYSLGVKETGQAGGFVARVVTAVEGWLLRRADCVVVIHDRFGSYAVQKLGVDASRVEVIRNWSHLKITQPDDVQQFRDRMGWGSEAVVLHAGNMGLKQGLMNVVEAARLADQRGESVRFVLIGNGSEKAELVAAAAGVVKVQFLAPLDDGDFITALYAADVLLVNELAGVSEMALPSKLTSYFTSGRPVLAAVDPDGLTAMEVRAAEAGIVVPAGNPAALLDGARQLAADASLAERLGANGRKYRETVLDEEFAIDRYAALLTRLAATRGRPRSRRPSSPEDSHD